MQYIFNVKEGIHEYVKLGRHYSFPPPPTKRCHNPKCSKMVHFRKHGFYERYYTSWEYKGKIVIRRYICPLCGCTISYIPHFCLPGFINALNHDKLIEDGIVKEGQISLTTLYRFLNSSNCKNIQETEEKKEIKRFAHQYINELWYGDVMYGPYIQEGRKKKPTYLMAYIDDASRLVAHAEFYYTQNLESLRHSFKEAVLKRGIPTLLYTDNGKIYRSQQFEFMCANIGCSLIHSKPFVASSRGKIERFFLTVRKRFLSQLNMNEIKSLEELNLRFWKWLDEDYHKKPHSSLNGSTPLDFFMSQISRVKLCTDPAQLEEKFLLSIKRKVNHDGTFPINKILYETDIKFAGQRVEVRYDPQWLDIPFMPVFIYHEDKKVGEAVQVNFHDNAHMKRKGRPKNSELTVDLLDDEVSVKPTNIQETKQTISFKTIMKGE